MHAGERCGSSTHLTFPINGLSDFLLYSIQNFLLRMVFRPKHCLPNRWFHLWADLLDECKETRTLFTPLGEARVRFQLQREA